jgi:RNA polymerase sigma-70 factor, ECF subfamily
MSSVLELCEALDRDRLGRDHLAAQFDAWWSARHPLAQDLLDELAARARSGDTAMEVLLGLIDGHGIARPALRKSLIAEHDIADAEQATLAAVALRVDRFEGRSRFTTWLHQVARNEAKMLIRARSRRPSTAVAEPDPPPFIARLSTLMADRDVIDRALGELPESFRRPLELREIDGLEYDEIAAELDIPVGTVRSRLSRGRGMLVTALRNELGDG